MKNFIATLLFLFTTIVIAQKLPKPNYTDLSNTKLAFYSSGQGNETIILLHGWPQTSHVWHKVIPELNTNYKIIAIDLPGLGNSDFVTDYSTENVSDILNEFIKNQNLGKIHLVGHDLGTWVALTFAVKYSENLKTLTLLDAGIPGLMNENVFKPENANKIWQFYFHGIDELPELLTKNKEKEYFDWYFDRKTFVKDALTKKDRKIYVNAYKQKGKMQAGFGYYRSYNTNAKYNLENITKLKMPVLAIGGAYALGENVGKSLERYARNLTTISLPNSGHYIPEEQPKQFSEILMNFIKNN